MGLFIVLFIPFWIPFYLLNGTIIYTKGAADIVLTQAGFCFLFIKWAGVITDFKRTYIHCKESFLSIDFIARPKRKVLDMPCKMDQKWLIFMKRLYHDSSIFTRYIHKIPNMHSPHTGRQNGSLAGMR